MYNITKTIISQYIAGSDIVDVVRNECGETTLVLRILKIIGNQNKPEQCYQKEQYDNLID